LSGETDLRESYAFKEYAHGRNKKVPYPWWTIIFAGIAVAIASILTVVFASTVFNNSWAFNFLIPLYGIPAGYLCAVKNKTYSLLVSLKYSSLSAVFYVGFFFVILSITQLASPDNAVGAIVGIISLLITCGIILVFSICVTFAIGAFFGTFISGIRDAKK